VAVKRPGSQPLIISLLCERGKGTKPERGCALESRRVGCARPWLREDRSCRGCAGTDSRLPKSLRRRTRPQAGERDRIVEIAMSTYRLFISAMRLARAAPHLAVRGRQCAHRAARAAAWRPPACGKMKRICRANAAAETVVNEARNRSRGFCRTDYSSALFANARHHVLARFGQDSDAHRRRPSAGDLVDTGRTADRPATPGRSCIIRRRLSA